MNSNKSFLIEHTSTYNGYKYVVIFSNMGHRCGYVLIEKDDELFVNIKSKNHIPFSKRKYKPEDEYEFIIGRHIPDFKYFDVHGGITFSQRSSYPLNNNKYPLVLGFDCGHFNDGKDFKAMLEFFPDSFEDLRQINLINNSDAEIRSTDYVVAECINLIKQLSSIKTQVIARNKLTSKRKIFFNK